MQCMVELNNNIILLNYALCHYFLGAEKTGAYVNPAMAIGHDLGCLGTSGSVHLLVFWAAPFIGAYLAVWLHSSFQKDHGTLSFCFFIFMVLLLVLFFPNATGCMG